MVAIGWVVAHSSCKQL